MTYFVLQSYFEVPLQKGKGKKNNSFLKEFATWKDENNLNP